MAETPLTPLKMREIAYFTFGRFQPPTRGHAVLVEGIARAAAEEGADPYIFVSSSLNKAANLTKKKYSNKRVAFLNTSEYNFNEKNQNPLNVSTKVYALRRMFPGLADRIINTTEVGATNVGAVVKLLLATGYARIVMMVGSDRVEQFRRFLPEEVEVRGIGAERVLTGAATANTRTISGTKMRLAALRKNTAAFRAGVQRGNLTNDNIDKLMADIREGIGMAGGSRKKKTRKARRKN